MRLASRGGLALLVSLSACSGHGGGGGVVAGAAGSAAGGIVSPAGASLGSIPGSGGTHATFGGVDGKTLFLVGDGAVLAQATSVAIIPMNLPGIQ